MKGKIVTLATSNGQHNVMVWRPSVCLYVPSAYLHGLPGDSMQRSQRTLWANNMEDQHTCWTCSVLCYRWQFNRVTAAFNAECEHWPEPSPSFFVYHQTPDSDVASFTLALHCQHPISNYFDAVSTPSLPHM